MMFYKEYRYESVIVLLCISLCLFLALLPFSIYGQDGYSHWYPVIAEYLRGSEAFRGSEVIFNGQNLGSLYGELPFWKILRVFHPSIETFLNLTHGIFVSLFFILSVIIVNGLSGEKSLKVAVLIFSFALFSPVLVNRIMAGHINLLYGSLPLFVFLSVIFKKSIPVLFIGFFSLWCAWSTHAFQLLAYHVFYIPVILYFFVKYEKNKKNFILISLGLFILSFLVNLPNFLEMVRQALSPDSLRPLDQNMTYSYTVSSVFDLFQFFTSGRYPEFMIRDMGFFHEINYPIGAFIFLFFVQSSDKKVSALVLLMFLVFFLFSANLPPANLLSELPGIKAFRVPQRIFILLGLLIPLWVLGTSRIKPSQKEIFYLAGLITTAQFVPYFDAFAILITVALWFINREKYLLLSLVIAFAGLTTGALDKLLEPYETHRVYSQAKERISPLLKAFKPDELIKRRFHFETTNPNLVNYVAHSLGIPTLEGYGYPPAYLIRKFEQSFGIRMASNQIIYIPPGLPDHEEKLRSYGVTTIVRFGSNDELQITEL